MLFDDELDRRPIVDRPWRQFLDDPFAWFRLAKAVLQLIDPERCTAMTTVRTPKV
jgi:hypothetical protein